LHALFLLNFLDCRLAFRLSFGDESLVLLKGVDHVETAGSRLLDQALVLQVLDYALKLRSLHLLFLESLNLELQLFVLSQFLLDLSLLSSLISLRLCDLQL